MDGGISMLFIEGKYENAVIKLFRGKLGCTYTYDPNLTRDYSTYLYATPPRSALASPDVGRAGDKK